MATFEEIQKAKILGSYNLFAKSEESLGGEMVKGGPGSGRKSGTFRVGDKIKFHPHTSLKASKDGKGTGYAKHEGKITHAYPDGHFDVEDSKGFIARHHPEKNNFEKGESFTDFVGGETEKKYHKNFQKEDPKNPDEEDSNKVVKSEDNCEVEEVVNLLNKSLFDELDIEKGGEGSRGGKVIGHTKSGKPIYAGRHESHHSFTKDEHKEAYEIKVSKARKHGYKHAPGGGDWASNHTKEIKHNKKWEKLHNDALDHYNPTLKDSSFYKYKD